MSLCRRLARKVGRVDVMIHEASHRNFAIVRYAYVKSVLKKSGG